MDVGGVGFTNDVSHHIAHVHHTCTGASKHTNKAGELGTPSHMAPELVSNSLAVPGVENGRCSVGLRNHRS